MPVTIKKSNIRKQETHRMYGSKLSNESEATLCDLCQRYIRASNVSPESFRYAWPSVFCSYWRNKLVDENVLKNVMQLLPENVLVQWSQSTLFGEIS